MDEDRLLKRKQRAKRDGNLRQLAEAIKDIGDLYFETGRPEDALQEYLEQLSICEALNDKLNCAIAHRMIGEVYASLGDYQRALTHQNLHLEGAKEVDDTLEEQRAFATLGRTHFCLAESLSEESPARNDALANAKRAYTKSIRLCNELEDTDVKLEEMMTMRARLLLNLGLVLEARKEPEQAIDLIENAAALCVKHNLHEDLHRTRLALAAIYERQGKFDLAEKHIDEAAEINNISLKAEARLSKVELFLRLGRWIDARKILVALYLTKGLPRKTNEQVQKYLRIVVTICRTEERLESETDPSVRQQLYETLGDAAVAARCFDSAIGYYRNMLSCMEETKSDRIGAALISLARTLKDAGRCEEALSFARRELQSCSDPREVCRSAVFLADLLNATNSRADEIEQSYALALNNAKLSESSSLEASVLKDYVYYLEGTGRLEEAQRMREKLVKLSGEACESDSEDDSESPDIGADICLDELSDVEDQRRGKEDGSTNRRRHRRAGLVVKRNEKGETQLHVACINGNVETVERLLTAGHPTDVRDHCGWTPLHEAANHDYLEIAKLLLDSGARVNDPGGSLCGGVTPLHDAASCGNLSMMRLLVKHGADLSLRTNEGDTVLDCLDGWKERAGELPANELRDYESLREELASLVPDSSKRKVRTPLRRRTDWSKLVDDEPENEAETERISASEDYRKTIASLKRRGGIVGPIVSRSVPKITTPLIDSEDALVGEWLEDDVGLNDRKKKSPRANVSLKRKSSNSNDTVESESKRPKPASNAVPYVFTSEDSCDSNTSELSDILDESRRNQKKCKRQISLLSSGFTRDSVSRTPSPVFPRFANTTAKQTSNTEAVNVRVTIEGTTFDLKLKGEDQRRDSIVSIVRRKFRCETGCDVEFELKTHNGQTVSNENIYDVLGGFEPVKRFDCETTKLEIPGIVERYRIICESNETAASECIIKSLKSCENTCVFRLKQYETSDEELILLLRTLEYQRDLRVLFLSGGVLLNAGALLRRCFAKLSHLQELDLQGCDVDKDCLATIERLPSQLRVLDLSYNPLGASSCDTMRKLLAPLKYLQTLNLRYCELDRLELPPDNNNLVNLDVSWNSLDSNDACHLLRRQLIDLNLCNAVRPSETSLVTSIVNNSRFSFANVECLNLAHCEVMDSDVINILARASNLSEFVLSGNPGVTRVSLNALLRHEPTLRRIDLSGCERVVELPESELYIKNPNACTLIVTMAQDVCEAWFHAWRGSGVLHRIPHGLIIIRPI